MSKELEALKILKANAILFDDGTDFGASMLEAINDLDIYLTPPTAEEVCKVLSEQLKTLIKTGKNKHGVTFNYVNTGKTLISVNYDLLNITVQLPPHLNTLIGRFYQKG